MWTYSTHSMGYDFYGLFCYYLSSPFSLLVLLFMKFMYVNDAVTAVILIKVGLCSVSMAWYSGKKYPGRGSMAVSLGCMYALSNFLMGYYSNVMWLDCICLLYTSESRKRIQMLGEHLHIYVDRVILELMVKLAKDKCLGTIQDVFTDTYLLLNKKKKNLKEPGNVDEQSIMLLLENFFIEE